MDTRTWKLYSLMAVASFSRIMRCATKQKWFRNGLRRTTASLRCWLGLQIPQISIQSSICGMCWTNKFDPFFKSFFFFFLLYMAFIDRSPEDVTEHVERELEWHASKGPMPKGSGVNVLVPDTTVHLQGCSGVHASMGQGCSGNKRGTKTILGRWYQCYAWLVYICYMVWHEISESASTEGFLNPLHHSSVAQCQIKVRVLVTNDPQS